jgi:hypothetical protein
MSHEICDFVSTKWVVEIRDKGCKEEEEEEERMDRLTTTILHNQTNL